MPLLPLEISLFPDDLLDRHSAESAERWWVLHTRPRAEKALARKFVERGVGFYLPLHHREWRARGRLRSSYLPLFPGYLFLHGDMQARLQALETNCVVSCLVVADQERLNADLVHVRQLIASGAPLTPEERLEPGSLVEIVAGPFTGMQGTLLRRGKKLKFVVEVRFLQQGVSVEIDASMVRPVLESRVATGS